MSSDHSSRSSSTSTQRRGPKPPPNLVGRESYLTAVEQELRATDRNAVVLYGPRRIGKTAVLLELLQDLPSPSFLPVYFDLMGWGELSFERFLAEVNKRSPWLDASHARRMVRAYGSRIDHVLAQSASAMGEEIAPGLYEAELDYLRREEWAASADDALWRRSKLGLHLSPAERQRVADWMEDGKQMKKVA